MRLIANITGTATTAIIITSHIVWFAEELLDSGSAISWSTDSLSRYCVSSEVSPDEGFS